MYSYFYWPPPPLFASFVDNCLSPRFMTQGISILLLHVFSYLPMGLEYLKAPADSKIVSFSSTACLKSPMFDFYEWEFSHSFSYCLLCTRFDKIDRIIDISVINLQFSYLADQNCIFWPLYNPLFHDLKKNPSFSRIVIC